LANIVQLEVPIHSPSGLAIGTICGVTNEPREGVDHKGITILNEIASAVMDHLDLVVSRVQRKRAERMINGLGLFAEGSEYNNWWKKGKGSTIDNEESMRRLTVQKQEGSVVVLGSPGSDDPTSNKKITSSAALDYFDIGTMLPKQAESVRPSPQNKNTSHLEGFDEAQEMSSSEDRAPIFQTTETQDSIRKPPPAVDTKADKPSKDGPTLSTDINETLARATRLIREAVDLNGVTFFNTRHKTPAQYSEPNTEPAVDPSEVFSRVLSSSISEDTVAFPSRFPEALLRLLLKEFPRGGILEFDREANFVSRTELQLLTGRPSQAAKSQEAAEVLEFDSPQRSSRGETELITELHVLMDIFPKARKIILFPLASTSNNLFAYAIGYTTDTTRVLQREDFTYITSFSNLIMAELSRIDTANADLAKSQFISSISHELRSPLHGMLASAELLKEAINDSTLVNIIDTIEACGSTLLDTLDNREYLTLATGLQEDRPECTQY
jgi:hypothetical protein